MSKLEYPRDDKKFELLLFMMCFSDYSWMSIKKCGWTENNVSLKRITYDTENIITAQQERYSLKIRYFMRNTWKNTFMNISQRFLTRKKTTKAKQEFFCFFTHLLISNYSLLASDFARDTFARIFSNEWCYGHRVGWLMEVNGARATDHLWGGWEKCRLVPIFT